MTEMPNTGKSQVILNPTVQWIFTVAITIILTLIGWSVNSIEKRSEARSFELERRICDLENNGSPVIRERLARIESNIQAIKDAQETQNRLLSDLISRERNYDRVESRGSR